MPAQGCRHGTQSHLVGCAVNMLLKAEACQIGMGEGLVTIAGPVLALDYLIFV